MGEHPGHDAEAQRGGEQAHDPDEPGQDAHQPEMVGAVVAGQPGDRAGGEQGCARLGADAQVPGAADGGIRDERPQGGMEASDGWHPGQLGIGHRLGHEQPANGEPGHHVEA